MNWDWEKLQERRQRKPAPPQDGDEKGDFDKLLSDKFSSLRNAKFPVGKVVLGLLVVLWLLSGIFIVDPDEKGVVLRFGKFLRTVEPGPHYNWPFPIETVYKPKVKAVQRIEIGYSQNDNTMRSRSQQNGAMDEASMLTGDENIVFVQFVVQFQIDQNHPEYFLFNVADPYSTIRSAAQASMRQVMGYTNIDSAITDGRKKIEEETRLLLQGVLDSYNAGIKVLGVEMQDVHPPKEVIDAFKDVASAREDKSRIINQAEAYRNEILPRARGQAAQTINEAEAYRQSTVLKADGESKRFLAVLAEYSKAKAPAAKRMYLEALEEILSSPQIEKIIMPDGKTAPVLPYLPIDRMNQGSAPAEKK